MTKHRACASIVAGSLLSLLTAGVACRSKETAASRSAAAFDEAQRKGTSVEKAGAHGGHGAPAGGKPADAAPADPHAAHGSAAETSGAKSGGEKAPMAGMDHSRMSGAGSGKPPAATAMDHSRMPGMDHGGTAGAGKAKQPATEMDHSTMPGMLQPKAGAMDHASMGHGAPMPPPSPEPAAASAQPGQPAATLQADDVDAPAATSLRDAERSAAMAKEMAGGHGMQHGTPYRQLDAGRDSESGPTHEHGAPAPRPTPSPTPKPSPHRHEGS